MPSKNPADFCHSSFRGRIGIARNDITPPIGIFSRNWGAAKHDVATSIHRPLLLSVLTLTSQTGGLPLVYIDADLGWWKTPQTAGKFLTQVKQAIGLESANLIFATSHTHAAPPLMEPEPGLPGGELMRSWMDQLLQTTIRTVREALESPFEGTLDWHTGHCNLATVRDFPDPHATKPRVICGFNPDVKADDTLIVGRITDSTGRIRGTVTNYACHPTTLAWDNTAISPDYIGAMRETIQEVTQAPALFMLGACGELAPRYQYVGDPEVADQHGRQLGFATLATLQDMEPSGTSLTFDGTVESGAPLAVWNHKPREVSAHLQAQMTSVDLPLKDWPTADELEQQRAACTDRAMQERLCRKRDIRRFLGDDSTFSLPIMVWRIGDAVLVGSFCEPYSLLQQTLRSQFPDHTILCMNLINGSIGYLPPADIYDVDVYPVWQTPFDRGCFEATLETMTKAIRDALK